jgi:glutathione peroxidase
MNRKTVLFATAALCGLLAASSAHAQEPADPAKPAKPANADTSKKPTDDVEAPPMAAGGGAGGRRGRGGAGRGGDTAGAPEKVLYDYELPGADGKGVPLSTYKGKTLLLVNLGRNSMYASQLAALEKLNEQYKDRNFVVIGIPSNDFGAAEPGTDPEIQKIYKVDDKVTFPVMAKSSLTGVSELPVFTFLTGVKGVPDNTGPVHWNYTKFLIDKSGKLVARFDPDVAPDSPEMSSAVEEVIAGTFKPRVPSENKPRGGRGGGMADDAPMD